jgi:2-aminoethylphosphonate-pyruvate transaminase
MIEKKMLFTPGPVMTSRRLKSVLAHPDLPHRQPAFEQILRRIRANLLTLFHADASYVAVVVSGSGTAANETALSSVVKAGEEVLLVKNGEFGNRLEDILACYGYKHTTLDLPWGVAPDPAAVDSALAANPRLAWVCMVFHETSTGMINPVHAVGQMVQARGRKLFVDCVSAVGGQDIDVLRDRIDICTGVPNKALAGTTGCSFVVARRECVPALGPRLPRRNIYLNLQKHIEWAEEKNQTPNTPAVTMFVALDAALEELLEEGQAERIRRYQQCAAILRAGVRALGLRILLPDSQASNTVTSVFLPAGVMLNPFIMELDRRGYVVYAGKGPFYEQNMFQIANMGWIRPADCRAFLKELGRTLRDMQKGGRAAAG